MEEQNYHLLEPINLIHSTSTTTSSSLTYDEVNPSNNGPGIIFRVGLIISIGLIAIWANHEASKGISITVINDAGQDTISGKYFKNIYEANDKASRIVYTTSRFVEDFLYPNETYFKKPVNHVILRLSSRDMTESVNVESHRDGEFVLYISPSVMEEMNYNHAMNFAVQKGMARIWIYNGLGHGGAPVNLMDGIIEYICGLAFSGGLSENGEVGWPENEAVGACWKSKKTKEMVQFLKYHERKRAGFIRRLNQDMRNGWHDRMVDDALGVRGEVTCATQNYSS